MASLGGRVPGAVQLPTIKLDTTLAELYRRARPDENAHARIGLVSCGISGGVDLTADFPRNAKFPYQDHALTRLPLRELRRGNVELQRSLAKKHLCLVTQRDAFISGNTPVVSFHLSRSPAHIEHARREAEATLAVLDPSQRPELVFCPGPADIPLAEHGIDRLEYKVVLDGLAAYPLTHDLETHWLLNSKAALARSGLPTPRADIIEPQGCPPPPGTCCPVCAASSSSPSSSLSSSYVPLIPARCTGARGAWLAAQTARILAAVRARPVPFAFKTQQAFGGAGTWLVATQAQKQRLLADLAPPPSYSSSSSSSSSSPPKADPPGQQQQEEEEDDDDDDDSPSVLRKLLSQVTRANAHLGPATVLLTELVRRRRRGPAAAAADSEEENHGLAFLVTSRGEAEFLAASEQMLADGHGGGSAWVGSVICYGRQDELRERFSGLMGRVARWVARRGYAGPVGVDVLLAGSSSGGGEGEGEGEQGLIVDLNVRTCGSLPLPLLRGHFVSRGLGCASNFSMTVGAGRAEFLERWRGPLEEGRMVILCWYEDPEARESIADVAVGGEDEARLGELMGRVREATEGVTF